MLRKLYLAQPVVYLAGTLFAFYTVVVDFMRFYNYEGTIFKLADCAVPNPVTTLCFYGAFVFLAGYIWSVYILRQSEKLQHQRRIVWLSVAGTLFAWGNFGYELIKFYSRPGFDPVVGCSGQLVSNPWLTPCFGGAVLFLLALINGYFTLKIAKRKLGFR